MSGEHNAGDGLGPQQVALLLSRIGKQVDRQLDRPLLVSVLRAAVFLAGYGGICLSVRGQHPLPRS